MKSKNINRKDAKKSQRAQRETDFHPKQKAMMNDDRHFNFYGGQRMPSDCLKYLLGLDFV